ncbi:MAG: M23 family metallopeptidase [Dermatophilaceae bacterium]
MSAGSYGGRHRGAKHATPKRRRFMTGLALPTAAAAALTFTATGAAVVTTAKTQSISQNAATSPASLGATAASVQLRDPRIQAIEDNAQDIARENAGARAARASERRSLAARAMEADRVARAHSWQLPIKNYVLTSGYGMRWGRLHAGEDFGVPVGTNLVSMSTGTVTFAGQESGYGIMVKIRYWDGTVSFYGHMSQVSVTDGETLLPGEVVGQSGNTGESTGPHLHLEIHPDGDQPVNPLPWLAGHKIAP